MSVRRRHILLVIGVILVASKCSAEALKTPTTDNSHGVQILHEERDFMGNHRKILKTGQLFHEEYRDFMGNSGTKILKFDELPEQVKLLETEKRKLSQANEQRLSESQESSETKQKRGKRSVEKSASLARGSKSKFKDEDADEDDNAMDGKEDEESQKEQVVRGRFLHFSNWQGVRLSVSSPFKQQQVVINGRTVTINDKVVCEDIRKLGKQQTYQKTNDGASWRTNLKVGRPMTPSEILSFNKEIREKETEDGKKVQQSVSEKTRFTNTKVGRSMVTSDMEEHSEGEIHTDDEEEEEGETKIQQNAGGKSQKQETREQERREKDQRRDAKRKQEEDEKLWIRRQKERLRREKQEVKKNAHNQKEGLKDKLRKLEKSGIEDIRRQKDGIRDKLRTQKSYLKEIENKL